MDTSLLMNIGFWVVLGLVMGFLARAILPGQQKIGLIPTLIVGVIGSFVGAFIGRAVGLDTSAPLAWQGLLAALGGSLIMLIIYCLITRKNWR